MTNILKHPQMDDRTTASDMWARANHDKSEQSIMPRKTAICRHGTFSYFNDDELIGLSLQIYGEYSEGEMIVFKSFIRPGDVVMDVGANIGAFTVPMSKLVGDTGKVYAWEANTDNLRLLDKNLSDNNCDDNVHVVAYAASDHYGTITISNQDAMHAYSNPDVNEGRFEIGCRKIDDIDIEKLAFLKIDVDRHELAVLKGAEETIRRCNPVIYVENEAPEQAVAMISWLVDHGYRCYWHKPYYFNPNNFNGERKNIFGVLWSIMMVCVPDPSSKNWDGLDFKGWDLEGLDEVADLRGDVGMFDREIARYTKISEQNPNDLMARLLAAMYQGLMQRTDKAAVLIEENLRREPDHNPTLNIKGLHLLQQGKWHEGWPLYELRFFQKNTSQFGGNRIHMSSQPDPRLNPIQEIPKWDGKPTDEVVLCWCEQGYGDQLMNARFFKQVVKRAPNAILEVSPELFELYDYRESRELLGLPKDFAPSCGEHDLGGRLFRLRRSLPKYTKQCSLGSVLSILDVGEEEIKIDGPYLDADPMLTRNWQATGNHPFAFGVHPMNDCKVGLCTVGSSRSERPYTRDLPPLLVRSLVKHGPFFSLEASHGFDSFACTAAAMKALDLVITVDTSVAHLAGALGVPVWLLLAWDCDFRWGLHGETTIWYNSMRIFRQPKFMDWVSVIDRVIAELEMLKL